MFAGRNSAGTHSAVLHQLEAGAEVGQADVAVHVQQDVVRLDVPERRKARTASDVFRFIHFLQTKKTIKTSKENRKLARACVLRRMQRVGGWSGFLFDGHTLTLQNPFLTCVCPLPVTAAGVAAIMHTNSVRSAVGLRGISRSDEGRALRRLRNTTPHNCCRTRGAVGGENGSCCQRLRANRHDWVQLHRMQNSRVSVRSYFRGAKKKRDVGTSQHEVINDGEYPTTTTGLERLTPSGNPRRGLMDALLLLEDSTCSFWRKLCSHYETMMNRSRRSPALHWNEKNMLMSQHPSTSDG